MNKRGICDEDIRVRLTHYKLVNPQKDEKFYNQNGGKPYAIQSGQHSQKSTIRSGKGNVNENGNSGGGTPTPLRYGKCGRLGHRIAECKNSAPICFNCGDQGNISTYYQKPNKDMINDELPQANRKVFAFNGVKASGLNNFIQGTCFISGVPLFPIIDTGVAHSFIPHDCLNKLNLKVSHIKFNMIIKKRTNGSVVT